MANLIGFLEYGHHAGIVHRLAHKVISSNLKTWHGNVYTWLDKDGNCEISVNGKTVYKGNVNTQ